MNKNKLMEFVKAIYSIDNSYIFPSDIPLVISDKELDEIIDKNYLKRYYASGHGEYYKRTADGKKFIKKTRK
jgi:hypothetical protein